MVMKRLLVTDKGYGYYVSKGPGSMYSLEFDKGQCIRLIKRPEYDVSEVTLIFDSFRSFDAAVRNDPEYKTGGDPYIVTFSNDEFEEYLHVADEETIEKFENWAITYWSTPDYKKHIMGEVRKAAIQWNLNFNTYKTAKDHQWTKDWWKNPIRHLYNRSKIVDRIDVDNKDFHNPYELTDDGWIWQMGQTTKGDEVPSKLWVPRKVKL